MENCNPFGMAMPGRTYSPNGYRYGFNGKENDKDISEGGQDYGMRIYDSRIGKFLSVDPLFKEYSWNSPYSFAENEPIANIDIDGLEKRRSNILDNDNKEGTASKINNAKEVAQLVGRWTFIGLKKGISWTEPLAALSVREYAIRKDPSVLNYDEAQKLNQFKSNLNNSIAILLYEFATGTGPSTRFFDATSPFAKEYAKGYVMEEVQKNFYDLVNQKNLTYSKINEDKLLGQQLSNISFSPDQIGLIETITKHINSNSAQFFVAGSDNVYIGEVSKDGVVTILVHNSTNKGSLMLHVDKVGLVDDPERNQKNESSYPENSLTTTHQYIEIKFKIDVSKLKNKSDFKKIIPTDLNRNQSNSDNTLIRTNTSSNSTTP